MRTTLTVRSPHYAVFGHSHFLPHSQESDPASFEGSTLQTGSMIWKNFCSVLRTLSPSLQPGSAMDLIMIWSPSSLRRQTRNLKRLNSHSESRCPSRTRRCCAVVENSGCWEGPSNLAA